MNYLPPAAAADAQAVIDDAARAAGRDPSSIRRIYNVPGAFRAKASNKLIARRSTPTGVVGPRSH
jgi:hypothetical protein